MAGDPSTRRRPKALDLRSWAIPRPVLAISAALAGAGLGVLTCLTLAPAEIVQPKLAVGIPTAADVFVALPVAV